MQKFFTTPATRVLSLSMALAAFGAVCGTMIPASSADARQDATTRFVVPLSDGVQMRCGSGVAWYPVATLSASTVLKAVDEADGWVRVEYPAGTPIVVKVDEAELQGDKVVLSRRSRLRAYNPGNPILEECYKAVFEQFLLPGVEMQFRAQVRDRAGAAVGLLVDAPAGATGYVLSRELRPANASELAKMAAGSAPAPVVTAPAPTAVAAETPVTTPEVASEQMASNTTEDGGDAVAEDAAPVDAIAANTIVTESAAPAASTPAEKPVAALAAVPTLRELDMAFEKMMQEPFDASDPSELIEQFRAYQGAHGDEFSTARSGEYLSSRIAALELRAKAKALSDALANADGALKRASETYGQAVDRLSKGREYQVVGRLLPSTVYDGKRLPLMYRLTSIDSSASRTLAYVVPDPELQLDNKLGAIVGILGESTNEPSQMVSVVRPVAVDVLQAAVSSAPTSN